MFRQAIAGPGPSTLLLRRLAQRGLVARPRQRGLHSSASAGSQPQLEQPDTVQREDMISAASASVAPSLPEHTIYAPPPLVHFDLDSSLQRIREGVGARSIQPVINEWLNISQSQAMDVVPDDDYAAMSRLIADVLNPPRALILSKLYLHAPEAYGALASMAVECGARGHMMGLNELFLKLITWGRPTETPELYARFVTRYRQIRGIRHDQLYDGDRNVRLAGRIRGEGTGLFQLLYIAALTQMGGLDSPAILSLLQFDGTPLWKQANKELWPIVRAAKLDNDPNFFKAFKANVDKYYFAIVCYHDTGLGQQIHKRSELGRRSLLQLYDHVIAAATGPERFLLPVQQWSLFGMKNTSVLLPAKIWAQFIIGFARLDASDQVEKILNVDMPAIIGGPIPLRVYAIALMTMGWMAFNPSATPERKQHLRTISDSIWAKARELGGDLDPVAIGKRIIQLAHCGRPKDALAFHDESRKRLQLNGINKPQPSIDHNYIEALIMMGKSRDLMKHLRTRTSEPTHDEKTALSGIVASILGSHLPYRERREAFGLLMSRKHPDVEIQPAAWGRILVFMLEASHDIPKVVAFIARKETVEAPGVFWLTIVQRLALHGSKRTSDVCHIAGIYILEHHLLRDTAISDFNQYWAFRYVCTAIANAHTMAADDRHALLMRAVGLVPESRTNVRRLVITALIETSIHRADGEGVSEAIYWFNQLDEPHGKVWATMIFGLVERGLPAVARSYAEKAPSHCPNHLWPFVHKAFGIKRPPRTRKEPKTLQETIDVDLKEDLEDAVMTEENERDVDDEDLVRA